MKGLCEKMLDWKKKHGALLFYILMLIYPMTQFAIFYVGVNFKSILMAFQQYDSTTASFEWVGLDNFVRAWRDIMAGGVMKSALKNSTLVYLVELFIGMPIKVLFSYYIFKKFRFHRFFKVLFFAPSILPGIILTMIFKIFANEALPEYLAMLGLNVAPLMSLDSPTRFPMVIFFCQWIGIGASLLLYTSTMEQISPSVLEAAKLDGVKPLREFWSIVLPSIRPTFNTFLIASIAGIFTNQANLFSFYGYSVPQSDTTYGYYLYRLASDTSLGKSEYGYVSALGLCASVVAFVITMVMRHYLNKSEE